MEKREYQLAPVTLENVDYKFNDVLSDALARHDDVLAATTKAQYLAFTELMVDYAEASSSSVFGRLVPQILLIHASQLNAETLNTLLTGLERHGYRFITLGEALKDPAYGKSEISVLSLSSCYLCWSSLLAAAGQNRASLPYPRPPAPVVTKSKAVQRCCRRVRIRIQKRYSTEPSQTERAAQSPYPPRSLSRFFCGFLRRIQSHS